MDKLEPTLDNRCGTESGYRRHRRSNEQKCQPCKDAHNIHRKATYNPEVNRKHAKKYREVHFESLRERQKKYSKHVDPEVKAARKAERAKATAERAEQKKLEKQARRQAKLEEMKAATALRQAAKAEEKARISAEKKAALAAKYAEMNRAREERKAAEKAERAAARKAARKAASEARRHQRNEERKANRKIRETNRTKLAHQHGTSPGDYDRCRKNNNGVACDSCKAAAAKYTREKFHSDPKYKEAEKRWRAANPNKTYRSNKDRARKHGNKYKYYTRQHIFDRDGYDCHLCSTPVDLTANHIVGQPGWELYPHIDHVQPISKGGDDTLENVKIAHAKCNLDKGAQFNGATA